MAKRFISSALALVLSLCMVFGILPVRSFADDDGTPECPTVGVEEPKPPKREDNAGPLEEYFPKPGIDGYSISPNN